MPPIRATYRLQLHAGFPLSAARELVPYLSRLGVSHLHCSPMLQARRGSTHGYDVVDPTRLDPELGTEADLAALHAELEAPGMGIVLDIVPNHMAASSEHPAWDDVLGHGAASAFARWFDIDWRATERELRSRVLLPLLGGPLSGILERGEIRLEARNGVPRVRYYEHDLPLDPSTMPDVLSDGLAACRRAMPREHPVCAELVAIIAELRRLPRRTTRRAAALARRRETAAVGRSASRIAGLGRGEGPERLLVAVPRLLASQVAAGASPIDRSLWEDTDLLLPEGWPSRWTCALTGRRLLVESDRRLRAAELFAILPAALLLADPES